MTSWTNWKKSNSLSLHVSRRLDHEAQGWASGRGGEKGD